MPGTGRPPLLVLLVPACRGRGTPVLPTHAPGRLPAGFLILQSCCQRRGGQGWLCAPALDTGLGTGEGWSRHRRAPARVASLSQVAGSADACFRVRGGLLRVPIGDASVQGCFVTEAPLPPQQRCPSSARGQPEGQGPAFRSDQLQSQTGKRLETFLMLIKI